MIDPLVKWVVLILGGFVIGMGWGAFWKEIDRSLKQWVESHNTLGQFIEGLVDLFHHTKGAVLLLIGALWLFYPAPIGVFLIVFALGIILVDAPQEKKRIVDIIVKLMLGKQKEAEEEVREIIEEHAETDDADKLLAEQLLGEDDNEDSGEGNVIGAEEPQITE